MGDKLASILTSRRAWAAIASLAVMLTYQRLGISEMQATVIAGVVSAWILGESYRSSEGFSNLIEEIRSVLKQDKTTPPS